MVRVPIDALRSPRRKVPAAASGNDDHASAVAMRCCRGVGGLSGGVGVGSDDCIFDHKEPWRSGDLLGK